MARQDTIKVLLMPAPDVAGQWIAHCLDWDLVTQGNSKEHALEMLYEAVGVVVSDDREHGRNPFDRKRAPQKFWDLAQRAERENSSESSVTLLSSPVFA